MCASRFLGGDFLKVAPTGLTALRRVSREAGEWEVQGGWLERVPGRAPLRVQQTPQRQALRDRDVLLGLCLGQFIKVETTSALTGQPFSVCSQGT